MTELVDSFRTFRDANQSKVKNMLSDNFVRMLDEEHPKIPSGHKLMFLTKALITGANPLMGEIFLIPRNKKEGNIWKTIGTVQFSYHFFLSRAMSTGEVDSFKVNCNVEDTFNPIERKITKQMVATAEVLKRNSQNPVVYKARWNEFYAEKSPQWNSKPCLMLEKCAIANVFRWAFPSQMQGIYIQEEMVEQQPTQKKEAPKDFPTFKLEKPVASKQTPNNGGSFDLGNDQDVNNFINNFVNKGS